MATLVLNNISKAFTKGTPVVREMNLRVADGEFIVIVGPSGCGKSTTLRLIAGLEAPDTGQVLLDGEDIAAISPGGRNIAMVFQDYALYAGMSVFENIAFPLRMRKLPKDEIQQKVAETAALLNLTELLPRNVRKLSGGDAVNVVPGSARALVNSPQPSRYDAVCEKARRFSEKSGFPLQTRRSGKSLEIRAEGLAAHGSVPEKGRNAISILLAFLGELSFVNEDVNEFIRFYNEYIGFCTDGSGLDCAFRDSRSGALTFNVGMLHYDREAVGVDCDIRYPVTCRGEQLYEAMMPVLDRFGMGLVKREEEPPLWFEPDDPLVESLMEIYREETGDREALPLVSGGGTYARDCPGTVAFGALFPGDEDRMHMRDEQITEERYLQLIRIYGKALIRLAGERQDPRDAQKARDVQNT